ncbi:MAG: GMC family oxidoreductase, partial [Aliidongia sp.]
MIRAGASLPDGGVTQFDVAIVGAGAIGIALAVRLMGRAGRIALIEAGDSKFEPAESLKFFKANEVDDSRHAGTELYRRRMLGGTTAVWGGRCIPFDPEDFLPAADRPGWPISFAEYEANIPDALAFFDAGQPQFSASETIPTHAVKLDESDAGIVIDRIERYSKPTNAWQKWREALARSPDVTVIHRAVCTNILTTGDGTRVTGIEIKTPETRCHKILAPMIVLACGGLETPRLLLASRWTKPCGLGNDHDLVGRHYMTHLVSNASNVGSIRFSKANTARAFDFNKTRDGVYGRRMILLPPDVRHRQGIPNIVFRPGRPAMDDASHRDPVLSTMFLLKSLLIPPEYARSLARDTRGIFQSLAWRDHGANIAAGVPKIFGFGLDWTRRRILAGRKLPSVFLYRPDGSYPLEFNAEHMPNPESRVLLGAEADALGMPRLVVRWRFRDHELDGICRGYQALSHAVEKSGLGEVKLDLDLPGSVRKALVAQGGHHIGTVRMSSDPKSGVVDPNAEVWGTRGLFVAGTAIFPTSSFANPTLTAVALAFRLAEHLVEQKSVHRRTG